MDSNPNRPEHEQNPEEKPNPVEDSPQSSERPYDEYDVAPAENVDNPNYDRDPEDIPAVDFTRAEEAAQREQDDAQESDVVYATTSTSDTGSAVYDNAQDSDVVYATGDAADTGSSTVYAGSATPSFYEKRVQPLLSRIGQWFRNLWNRFVQWVRNNPRDAAIALGVLILLILSIIFRAPSPHVSLPAEPISERAPSWLTNSLLTTFLVDIVIIALALLATRNVRLVPRGFQNVMEMIIEYLYGLAEGIAGKNARIFFPWVMTIFIYVIISNWSGLIPGVGAFGYKYEGYHGGDIEHSEEELEFEQPSEELAPGEDGEGSVLDFQIASTDASTLFFPGDAAPAAAEEGEGFIPLFRAPSADVNMTFALALITMVLVQYYGIKFQGANTYRRKFFLWEGPNLGMKIINAFVGFLEFLAQFSRFLAFGFRLFGNIFAGEIVLLTMIFLVAFLIPMPFYALEIFIGFVQALVFYMLALVFFTESTVVHGEHH